MQGQLGHEEKANRSTPTLIRAFTPQNNSRVFGAPVKRRAFVDLAAGWMQSFAVSAENEVFAWGHNAFGQLGLSHRYGLANADEPIYVEALRRVPVVAAATGRAHTLFLSARHEVFTVGDGGLGQLGVGQPSEESAAGHPVRLDALRGVRVVMIAAGLDHSVALDDEGRVYSWGWNADGQLGHGGRHDEFEPRQIEELKDLRIVNVSCGDDFTLFLTDEGEVFACGSNDVCQLGLGDNISRDRPVPLAGLADEEIIGIAAGSTHALALNASNALFAWGVNAEGQLGVAHDDYDQPLPPPPEDDERFGEAGDERTRGEQLSGDLQRAPKRVTTLPAKPVAQIGAGGAFSAALFEDGELWTWGFGMHGRLGHGDEQNQYEPRRVESFKRKRAVQFALGMDHMLVMTQND